MLFPHGSHTMEKLLCQLAGLCLAAIKYAIPTPKKWQKAAGASGKGVGRVFQAASLRKGGLTVEAALALPLWLGALFALAGLLQAQMLAEQVNHHLCMTARKAAAYSVSEDGISQAELLQCFYSGLSGGTLQTGLIRGGAAGILLTVTEDRQDGIFCLKAVYSVKLPGVFGIKKSYTATDKVYGRIWTGIRLPDGDGSGSASGKGQSYYVAENGVVYHTDAGCTYLDLSIHAVSGDSLQYKRNLYGSRYVPCSKCAGDPGNTVYITNQGEAWHTDPNCSGLKRTVNLQDEEEAHEHGLRPCPRCGGGG